MHEAYKHAITAVVAAITGALLAIVLICGARPWAHEASVSTSQLAAGTVTLTSDTPVVHEWRDAEGNEVGHYVTTLYEYNNVAADVAENTRFREDVTALLHWMATDPEMRGHLLAHDMTEAQLDEVAERFAPGREAEEAFMAYTEQ